MSCGQPGRFGMCARHVHNAVRSAFVVVCRGAIPVALLCAGAALGRELAQWAALFTVRLAGKTFSSQKLRHRQVVACAEPCCPDGPRETEAGGNLQSEDEVRSRTADLCMTQGLAQRVGELGGVCPVDMLPMFDPVRVVHIDEELREFRGAAPHILGRCSAERWLAQDPGRRCPLCNVEVLRLDSDASSLSELADAVRELAALSYTDGENLAHKAVKLCDARLFVLIGRFLPTQEVKGMLAHPGCSGVSPLELLNEQDPGRVREFLSDLPVCPDVEIKVVRSTLSTKHGGSAFWLDQRRKVPLHPGHACNSDAGDSKYVFLRFVNVQSDVLDGPNERKKHTVCGYAVLLVTQSQRGLCGLFQCPITEAMVSSGEGFDDEVFEPAIAVRSGNREEIFQGRVAARRGVWIGGVNHFDDFVLTKIPGAAVVLIFEVSSNKWQLFPGDAPVTVQRGDEETGVSCEGIGIDDGEELQVSISIGEGQSRVVACRPIFTSRRWSAAMDAISSFPASAVALANSLQLRERLVLIEFEVSAPDASGQRSRTRQIGAVFSDFVVGRSPGSSLQVSGYVSRAHCVLTLSADEQHKLHAYDDGSLGGTRLDTCLATEQRLGVGREAATAVREGHVLRLNETLVKLKTVSPLLQASDNLGLAAFFDCTGEREVSQRFTSLSLEPPDATMTMDVLSQGLSMSQRFVLEPSR